MLTLESIDREDNFDGEEFVTFIHENKYIVNALFVSLKSFHFRNVRNAIFERESSDDELTSCILKFPNEFRAFVNLVLLSSSLQNTKREVKDLSIAHVTFFVSSRYAQNVALWDYTGICEQIGELFPDKKLLQVEKAYEKQAIKKMKTTVKSTTTKILTKCMSQCLVDSKEGHSVGQSKTQMCEHPDWQGIDNILADLKSALSGEIGACRMFVGGGSDVHGSLLGGRYSTKGDT